MELNDIIRFQFKRVNPFEGLMVDADAWRDAHAYHRDHQRLHVLAFHPVGIVRGLEVVPSTPPDQSVVINPGMGVDTEGNVIIVAQELRHKLETRSKAQIYLIIQFREIPTGPNQPPDGGRPTRILEAYRIQERDRLPDEPHLELARIDYDPSNQAINKARDSLKPGRNEIDLRFRKEIGQGPHEVPLQAREEVSRPAIVVERPSPTMEPASLPTKTITLGHAVLGGASSDLHVVGLRSVVKEAKLHGLEVRLKENLTLGEDIHQCNILYLTGNTRFKLTAKQQESLVNFIGAGRLVFGDGCAYTAVGGDGRGAKEFGLAFNELAILVKCKLENVQRGHPLLSAAHMYSAPPQGADPGMILVGGNIVYTTSDYGCAWQGGREGQPLSREVIRNSIEITTNIITYGNGHM